MRFIARFLRGEAAGGLLKRFVKDTLVSGCATLCVSMALSGITKNMTLSPGAHPSVPVEDAVEIEPLQPIRDLSAPARTLLADAGAKRTPAAVAVGIATLDPRQADAVQRHAGSRDSTTPRVRRTAAAAAPSQLAQVAKPPQPEPVRVVQAVDVQPLPPASAPVELVAPGQRADEGRSEPGPLRFFQHAVSFVRESGQAVTATAADMKDRMWSATGEVLSSVLR